MLPWKMSRYLALRRRLSSWEHPYEKLQSSIFKDAINRFAKANKWVSKADHLSYKIDLVVYFVNGQCNGVNDAFSFGQKWREPYMSVAEFWFNDNSIYLPIKHENPDLLSLCQRHTTSFIYFICMQHDLIHRNVIQVIVWIELPSTLSSQLVPALWIRYNKVQYSHFVQTDDPGLCLNHGVVWNSHIQTGGSLLRPMGSPWLP